MDNRSIAAGIVPAPVGIDSHSAANSARSSSGIGPIPSRGAGRQPVNLGGYLGHLQPEAGGFLFGLEPLLRSARSTMMVRGYTLPSLAREMEISVERLERALSDPAHLTVRGMAAICDVLEIRLNLLEQYLPRR